MKNLINAIGTLFVLIGESFGAWLKVNQRHMTTGEKPVEAQNLLQKLGILHIWYEWIFVPGEGKVPYLGLNRTIEETSQLVSSHLAVWEQQVSCLLRIFGGSWPLLLNYGKKLAVINRTGVFLTTRVAPERSVRNSDGSGFIPVRLMRKLGLNPHLPVQVVGIRPDGSAGFFKGILIPAKNISTIILGPGMIKVGSSDGNWLINIVRAIEPSKGWVSSQFTGFFGTDPETVTAFDAIATQVMATFTPDLKNQPAGKLLEVSGVFHLHPYIYRAYRKQLLLQWKKLVKSGAIRAAHHTVVIDDSIVGKGQAMVPGLEAGQIRWILRSPNYQAFSIQRYLVIPRAGGYEHVNVVVMNSHDVKNVLIGDDDGDSVLVLDLPQSVNLHPFWLDEDEIGRRTMTEYPSVVLDYGKEAVYGQISKKLNSQIGKVSMLLARLVQDWPKNAETLDYISACGDTAQAEVDNFKKSIATPVSVQEKMDKLEKLLWNTATTRVLARMNEEERYAVRHMFKNVAAREGSSLWREYRRLARAEVNSLSQSRHRKLYKAFCDAVKKIEETGDYIAMGPLVPVAHLAKDFIVDKTASLPLLLASKAIIGLVKKVNAMEKPMSLKAFQMIFSDHIGLAIPTDKEKKYYAELKEILRKAAPKKAVTFFDDEEGEWVEEPAEAPQQFDELFASIALFAQSIGLEKAHWFWQQDHNTSNEKSMATMAVWLMSALLTQPLPLHLGTTLVFNVQSTDDVPTGEYSVVEINKSHFLVQEGAAQILVYDNQVHNLCGAKRVSVTACRVCGTKKGKSRTLEATILKEE